VEQQNIDRHPEDMQIVFRATYSGDVRLSMTAEVVLDYPMPSFVGIPLKLNITGMTFDGVGILAYIKKRAHLCFLGPDDAEAFVGSEDAAVSLDEEASPGGALPPHPVGGLLEEIKIESEMGETEEGKQVLKNVGKIEKFILEQVQRIFEDEFVYPSFWTFLV
jgi:mitochondrial distribution and morphology protein 12